MNWITLMSAFLAVSCKVFVPSEDSKVMDQSVVAEANPESETTVNRCSRLAGGAWVYVGQNRSVGQDQDFCLMKYEAKRNDDSIIPRSVPEGKPWVRINLKEATAACEALGPGYSPPTLAMWQTVAHDIEENDRNWGTRGGRSHNHSILNYGNAIRGESFAASDNDQFGCYGSIGERETLAASGCDWNAYKRTHLLADGSVIWDLAGNVTEWVDVRGRLPLDTSIRKYARALLLPEEKMHLGPAGDYSRKHGPYEAGLGYIMVKHKHNALTRGGFSGYGEGHTGIFAAISYDADERLNGLGFRCAYVLVPQDKNL